MTDEAQLVFSIENLDKHIKSFSSKIIQLHKTIVSHESDMIEYKIEKTKLEEELRLLSLRNISTDLTDNQSEIEQFRKDNPEIIQWIKDGRPV